MQKKTTAKKTTTSNELKPEDFSWLENNSLIQSVKLKKEILENFSKFPLENWKNLITKEIINIEEFRKIGKLYEKVSNIILRDDIFINQKFLIEPDEYEIKKKFEDTKSIKSDIHPDFMIKKIKKEDLLQILKEYDYMFR